MEGGRGEGRSRRRWWWWRRKGVGRGGVGG